MKPILEVNNLTKSFPILGGFFKRPVGYIQALRDVSFTVNQSETLAIVGESGCGKTTLGRTIIRLYEPTSGKVFYSGKDLTTLSQSELKSTRRNMQMIFQDPYGSLNPRMNVEHILEEPFYLHSLFTPEERKKKIRRLIDVVGLSPNSLQRFPHEFSGGQRQRISIARALALEPQIIIADEPVSALDVSIQSQVLNLMVDLQKELKLTYIFISHDLSVVKYISDRVGVMYLGKMVELAPTEELFKDPKHPYTKALLASIPKASPHDRGLNHCLEGDIPSPANPPKGCSFHPRCQNAFAPCHVQEPVLQEVGAQRFVACHLYK